MMNLPVTESLNPHTEDLDQLPTLTMLERINQEDQQVALAVATSRHILFLCTTT